MIAPRVWTASELLREEHPEPVFIVEDLLPVGLTILAGRPKSGKSRAALDLAVNVSTGGTFLGHPCNAGAVHYFALEDGPRRLSRRLAALGGADTDRLSFCCETPADLVGAIRALYDSGTVCVVVDTLGRAFSFDHNDQEKVYEVMAPLQALATHFERSLVVIDHLRKGRGETAGVEDVAGSIGKAASADNLWLLDRPARQKNATLDIISRDLDEDLSLALEPVDGGGWHCVGNADAVRRTEGRQKLLDACTAVHRAGDDITVTTVSASGGFDGGYVSRTLSDLVEIGDLVRLPKRGTIQPYALKNPVNKVNMVNNEGGKLTFLPLLTTPVWGEL
ncbi:MAG: AAA family ATPase [bacterium]|nr:AAA family ATPase [bacterium]